MLIQFNLDYNWLVSKELGFRRPATPRRRVRSLSKDPRVARLFTGMHPVRIPCLQPTVHGSSARP